MHLLSWWLGVLLEDWKNGGFGLYVHWPFCVSKCPYCDFNSHVSQNINHDEWGRAYLTAIEHYAAETPDRTLASIYFGGGTPSLMQPALVQSIVDRAQKLWHFSNDIEITLEANPGSVEASRFEGFRLAGVNRVSLGVQALNDADLRRLGRMHSVAEALSALEVARTNFDRISFDLIYARQDQSLLSWEKELTSALEFNPDHLSLYQLTVEPGTVFGARDRAGKLAGLPSEDRSADMYDLTQTLCDIKGLPAYEVSNHAHPGMESRHNMIYWMAGDYVGIGPGAHGRLTLAKRRYATETPLAPEAWLRSVLTSQSGEAQRHLLSGKEQALEYLIMGLRTVRGISLDRFAAMGSQPVDAEKIRSLRELGMIEISGKTLRATRKGMPVLNALLRELAPD